MLQERIRTLCSTPMIAIVYIARILCINCKPIKLYTYMWKMYFFDIYFTFFLAIIQIRIGKITRYLYMWGLFCKQTLYINFPKQDRSLKWTGTTTIKLIVRQIQVLHKTILYSVDSKKDKAVLRWLVKHMNNSNNNNNKMAFFPFF